MAKFMSDNGREFNNENLHDMAANFNIRVLTTAAESPFSNGTCECLNYILAENVKHIVDDVGCDISMALAWVVSTLNVLQNNHRFSQNLLVFGFNPVFPNVNKNQLPALEKKIDSKVVADNLNVLHAAKEAFLKNESNELLCRALLHNVRSTNLEELENGQIVYYKRGELHWRGPGTIIGRNGKLIIVRHGEHISVLMNVICKWQNIN